MILSEFFTAKSIPEQFSAEDELSRGLQTMLKANKIFLSLIFATALFLDIHRILQNGVNQCFERFVATAQYAHNTISLNFEFTRAPGSTHGQRRMSTLPKISITSSSLFL